MVYGEHFRRCLNECLYDLALQFFQFTVGCIDLRDLLIQFIYQFLLFKPVADDQQKVVVGKWLMTESSVLIFDEPTRGIDVGAKVEIYKIMTEFAKQGVGIMMISSELPEILGMSDRILVMCNGEIAAEMERNEASQEKILYYATGGGKADG